MRRDFEFVLDDCLHYLGAGGDVNACLARYPEYASELQPLLQLAADLSAVDTPPPAESARQAARQRMLASVRRRPSQATSTTILSRLVGRLVPSKASKIRYARRFATLVPVVLLVLLTSAVTVRASRSSVPGDALYPVKLTAQRARMFLTLDKSNRDSLIQQIDEERRQDIQSALQGDHEAKVAFEGVLQQISKGEWIVGGLRVSLNADTVVQGKPVIGAEVSVRGRLPGDGTLLAVSLFVGERDDLFLSPLPTPSPSATSIPIETEDADDGDGLNPELVETDEWEDDDYTGTPEATETDDLDDGSDVTPEPVETDEPGDEDATMEPDDDDSVTPEPDSDPDDEDDSTPTPTDDPDDDVTATPVPSGTEEPDDDETPEPDGTSEPDGDDDESESTKEPED